MKLYRRLDNNQFTPAARIRVRTTVNDQGDAVSNEMSSTPEHVSTCEYFHFQNLQFSVQDHMGPVIKELLSLQAGRDETYFGEEEGSAAGPPAVTHANKCWYCWNKLTVTIMDMLTYPRPIRKVRPVVIFARLFRS